MAQKSFKVKSDGKDLTFTPGENGSLTYQGNINGSDLNIPSTQPAKAIPAPVVSADTKKNRMNIIRALVGSSRG